MVHGSIGRVAKPAAIGLGVLAAAGLVLLELLCRAIEEEDRLAAEEYEYRYGRLT